MQDIPMFRQSHRVYATFQRVDGLNPGSYVYVNGVKVGSVKNVDLTRSDSVRIAMNIDLANKIPKGSVAILKPMDLLGSKAVIIEKSNRREYVKHGGEIEGDYIEGMM
jgi:phospholipid/cholesterol/gamma-HCH transport system substrate-binding protein